MYDIMLITGYSVMITGLALMIYVAAYRAGYKKRLNETRISNA